jgi:hypothetical protein
MRLALVLLAGLCVVLAGCASPVADKPATSPQVLGYPLPKGNTFEASTSSPHAEKTLHIGDVVVVPRYADQVAADTDLLVLAEITAAELIFQAVRAGSERLRTGPIPERTCDDGQGCAIPPPSVKLTII